MSIINQCTRKISVIFGTRPEAIKLAPIIKELQKDRRFVCNVCVTAQHREMLDDALAVFEIVADKDLNLMSANQTLGMLTSRAIATLDSYMMTEKPDFVLVQGDTTTTFCATLAAFYHHIPVGHVEAGLRTWNLEAPWPEEANRILTSKLATLHFTPTESSKTNLLKEGVSEESIIVTGNSVIDALFLALEKIKSCQIEIPGLPRDILQLLDSRPIVLITGHRRESFGEGFRNICKAIANLSKAFPEVRFIYPVHLNPNVREPVTEILGRAGEDNVYLIDPLPYLPFVALMNRSTIILTDSGGIQEEAPSLGKPVLVMRDTTERPEALDAGTVKLVGTRTEKIEEEVSRLLTDRVAYNVMAREHNLYGDGKAARRIVEACGLYLSRLS